MSPAQSVPTAPSGGGPTEANETFSSRWGMIWVVIGTAIGTGNVWRFPRIAAENGGGAFLIPWMLFMVLWSMPLLWTEFAIGRHTRRGPLGSFRQMTQGKATWMGGFVAVCTLGIAFYYTVVTGWCFRYLGTAITQGFAGITQESASIEFNRFTGSWQPVAFHIGATLVAGWVTMRGIVAGVERVNKILIPILIVVLLVLAARAVSLPGGVLGLQFLYQADFSRLAEQKVWLNALSQSAWSAGAGWGLTLVIGNYMRKDEDFVVSSLISGFANNTASLLSAMMIFPTVFAVGSAAAGGAVSAAEILGGTSNNGLAFSWMPALFAVMPGGKFFGVLFFLGLSFAAFSSLLTMLEFGVGVVVDLGISRRRAVAIITALIFILGMPSALSMTVLDNQDWVWGLGLMINGAMIVGLVWYYGIDRFRQDFIDVPSNDLAVGKLYNILIRYVFPVEFIGMMVWWFYGSIKTVPNWYDPRATFGLATCLLQWGAALGVFALSRRWLNQRLQTNEKVAS